MRTWRILLITAGLALGLYGVFRLVTGVPIGSVLAVGVWLVAAVVIHDGVLSPAILAVGAALARMPARARRYVQAGLVVVALVTVVALPLIARRHTQPTVKALLLRDYAADLGLLLGLIGAATLAAYAIHVARDVRRSTTSSDRADGTPPATTNLE